MRNILISFIALSFFLSCNERSKDSNTNSPETKNNEDSINILAKNSPIPTYDTVTLNSIPEEPGQPKQKVEELIVEEVKEKNSPDFKKYYSFQIRNNTIYTLTSFKFSFEYASYDLDNNPPKKYEYVIIKNYLGPSESAIINVYTPEVLLMKEESTNTIVSNPKLYGAINSENEIIYASEGNRIEREKVDDFIKERMEKTKNAGKEKY